MSSALYYPLSPVERTCPSCNGFGHEHGGHGELLVCSRCDGSGRWFIDGGPSFGCKMSLDDCKPGQIATLGNGDRGRVVRHCLRGTPTTEIALIDPFFDEESAETTTYPSSTGVVSASVSSWFEDSSGGSRGKEDHLDPLQRRTEAQ